MFAQISDNQLQEVNYTMAKSARIVIACLLLVAVSSCEASPADSLLSHWTAFKAQYGKRYASQLEEAKRMELFAKNKLRIDQFNREQSQQAGYTLAVNHLSDRTDEEFKQLLGFKVAPKQMQLITSKEVFERPVGSVVGDVPESLDWRKSGRVSTVKDQGQCGSDWAFAAAGALEGLELPARMIKKPIGLSTQNIMDCGFFFEQPCNGGDTFQALADVAYNGGVESEQDYPYLAAAGESCKFNKSRSVIVNKATGIWGRDEPALLEALVKFGPIAVAMEVTESGNFKNYKSGVFSDPNCHHDYTYRNHAVLVVGYGTDPREGDYWIVKNSWSSSWGEEGYFRIARNKNSMCGIGFLPIFVES